MSEIDILTTYLKNKIYSKCKFVYNCTYRKIRGKIFIWVDNSLSKNHRPQKNDMNARHRTPSFELLVMVVQDIPQTC